MVIGPRAKPTPEGLEVAAEKARVAHKAQHELYLEVKRLLERDDRDTLYAWARSLTSTNCDYRLYDVGQQILRDYPYVAAAPDRATSAGRETVVIDGKTYVEPEDNTNADWLKFALHMDRCSAALPAAPDRQFAEGGDGR